MSAERKPDRVAAAGGDHLRHRRRVANRRDCDVVQVLPQNFGDDRHHVLRAARAAVVAVIDQQHRSAGRGFAQRGAPRPPIRPAAVLRTRTRRAAPRRSPACGRKPRALRHRRRGGASATTIADTPVYGVSACGNDGSRRGGEHFAARLHVARVAQDVARRPVFGRVPHDRGQQRQPAPCHHRLDLAVERAQQDFPGQLADLVHVDVRIRLVAGDHRRVVDELGRKIRVVVERHRDRQLRRDRAQPPARSRLRHRRSPRSPSRRADRARPRRSRRAPLPRAGAPAPRTSRARSCSTARLRRRPASRSRRLRARARSR